MTAGRTLVLLYPGCIAFEVMLAAELLNPTLPVDVVTPDGAIHIASNGLQIQPRGDFASVVIGDYRCVLVPGGDTYDLIPNRPVEHVLQQGLVQGALIGAICAGPLILAKSGLLKGRRFTHGFGDHYQDFLAPYWADALFVDEPVVVDGPIVTAQPYAHVAFGVTIANRLGVIPDEKVAERIAYYQGAKAQI